MNWVVTLGGKSKGKNEDLPFSIKECMQGPGSPSGAQMDESAASLSRSSGHSRSDKKFSSEIRNRSSWRELRMDNFYSADEGPDSDVNSSVARNARSKKQRKRARN